MDEKDLPTSFRNNENTVLALGNGHNIDAFLDKELSVQRIDEVFDHLWLVGRPYPPRPLTIQNVLNRKLIPVPEAAMHLVWASDRMYIKPLPRFMLSDSFYECYLGHESTRIPGHGQDALGLLFSYITLIPTEVDFEIALHEHLMPPRYTWEEWRLRVALVLRQYPEDEIYSHIPRRYIYGELRHDRLHKVYRYLHGNWHHGYSPLIGAATYAGFFDDNLGPITAATVYIILVLTALQVMLAATTVSTALGSASYVISIISVVGPLAGVAVIIVILGMLIIINWIKTVRAQKARFAQLSRSNRSGGSGTEMRSSRLA